MPSRPQPRRERHRQQTRAEIKEHALAQLADHGPGALSLNAIARQMGMSGPGLYRYFASRDDLLTELVLDGYRDLADTLWASVERSTGEPTPDRLRALGRTYRAWALANPHRYLLLFGTPVPGFTPTGGQTTAAAQHALAAIAALMGEQPRRRPADALDRACSAWAERVGLDLTGSALRHVLVFWTRLHGVLSLEIEGHFDPVLPPADLLYESELGDLIATA